MTGTLMGSATNYAPIDTRSSGDRSITSERSLQQKQEQIMKLQDGMLEDIAKGVDHLKQKVRCFQLYINKSQQFCSKIKRGLTKAKILFMFIHIRLT